MNLSNTLITIEDLYSKVEENEILLLETLAIFLTNNTGIYVFYL